MPCNLNLRELAEHVKRGIRDAGGTPMEFNTIAISDGVTMGTEGMKPRSSAAKSSRTRSSRRARAHVRCDDRPRRCDKTSRAPRWRCMRLERRPPLIVYGGSIAPGKYNGEDLTIVDIYEAIGARAAGKIDDHDSSDREYAVPGAGACGGQFTANTMATVFEFWASHRGKREARVRPIRARTQTATSGQDRAWNCCAATCAARPVDARSVRNGIAAAAGTGGSTNSVLHLLAMAREAGVPSKWKISTGSASGRRSSRICVRAGVRRARRRRAPAESA